MNVFKIPTPTFSSGVLFDYDGVTYGLSTVRRSGFEGQLQYIIDITWEDRIIYGIEVVEGANLVKQYGGCAIPSLYAKQKIGVTTTPTSLGDIFDLYILEA